MKMVVRLSQAGLLETVRGRAGGLRLVHTPAKIRLGDLVRLTEHRQGHSEDGTREPDAVRQVLDEATNAYFQALNSHTLADLATMPVAQS